jgi:transposase-like protein
MALMDKAFRDKQKAKIVERIQEGLTTRQISDRLGVTSRQVLRVRKWIKEQESQHLNT